MQETVVLELVLELGSHGQNFRGSLVDDGLGKEGGLGHTDKTDSGILAYFAGSGGQIFGKGPRKWATPGLVSQLPSPWSCAHEHGDPWRRSIKFGGRWVP